ncbi:MAG TPA: Mut7-C RNAse domain-containing protein [Candidatus Omnitrophota bacterium]|nr:Mut7-C RNAse domain-containing protein [Candidatus Omnitrophota bacterium]
MRTNLTFRFIGECNLFLDKEKRYRIFSLTVNDRPSVKDTIEALGVPHTEVDGIIVNGQPVTFIYQLKDGDSIRVYPRWGRQARAGHRSLQKHLPLHPRFVCDVHLGKLVRHLRLLGFDACYKIDFKDDEIVELAAKQRRIILTRDIGLLKNKRIVWGYFVRTMDSNKQIKEVVKHLRLSPKVRPFRLCLNCNGRIQRIAKSKVAEKLPPKVRAHYQEFYICKSCDKIYWKGSHHRRLHLIVSQVLKLDC